MHQKSLEKLEYHKIKNILSSYCVTFKGKEYASELSPMKNKEDIEIKLKSTTEASTLLYRKGNIPISEIADISIHVKNLNSGKFLSIKQLLDLVKILKISSDLKNYFFGNELSIKIEDFDTIESLFDNLYENKSITNTINQAIIDENTLSDNASPELNSIRKKIRNTKQEINNKLNSFLHSKYLQEPVITIRSGRYVLPVKSEYKQNVKGFSHDISSSGSTIFIEPISVFELNNDLNNLEKEEQIKIEEVLQKLSSLFFNIISNVKNDVDLIGQLDFIFAKGKYSNDINGSEPTIINGKEKYIDLYSAWHPLINPSEVVKNDIFIGESNNSKENYTSLIITGPNTGGKTVILKTVGIITLMALSGLHIPAKEGSTIYLFDNIFADIGDDQSISESLSTFSSHITNISFILNNATTNSLVLIDELGAGTDPIEGSSLAISILQHLQFQKILTVSTTHYPDIKHYALVTDGFKNASVEFDVETLSPTYKLLLGVPGTSNAFAISQKLGIPSSIIENAKSFMKNDDIKIETLLTNIYEDKKTIEKEKEEIEKNSKEISELKKALNIDLTELNAKKVQIIEDAKSEARNILLDAKDDANEIIKTLEKTNSNKEANKQREILNQKLDNLSSTLSKPKEIKNIDDIKIGTKVFIPKINQHGDVVSISKSGKIEVLLPLGKSYFELDSLELSSSNNVVPKKNNNANTFKKSNNFNPKAIHSEINVLGMTVLEACDIIDKFLDTATLSGLSTVRIIHGKGTGALRKGIHDYLKNHPHVKSYRLGTFGEGDVGVTIVELK